MSLATKTVDPRLVAARAGIRRWILWWLFSQSGARHATGRARLAALVALVVFTLHALLLVIASLLRFLPAGR